ncbi:DUF29 domain-containing protein [Afifella sp. YEN Y35]|uniref:DUF29 domain-containing protein n=1 Tax=Afifella sp. YEN Y35 TaxID=3388337 RepID=UPI0039DF6D2B
MSSEPLKKPAEAEPLYEADFFRWTQEQAEALRTRRLADLDWANLAEEIETLGRSDRSEIRSRLTVILLHLLKWRHQPEQRKGGWKASIFEQRVRIADLLEDSPSLHSYPATVLAKEYRIARLKAADETGLPEDRFPETCPFTIEEILDETFLPKAEE